MLKTESTIQGTNSMPFLIFRRDHLRSTSGIICGPHRFGIICGPIWGSFPVWGLFAVGDHLRRCTDHTRWKSGNILENLQRNNVARQVEGFYISYFAAFRWVLLPRVTIWARPIWGFISLIACLNFCSSSALLYITLLFCFVVKERMNSFFFPPFCILQFGFWNNGIQNRLRMDDFNATFLMPSFKFWDACSLWDLITYIFYVFSILGPI